MKNLHDLQMRKKELEKEMQTLKEQFNVNTSKHENRRNKRHAKQYAINYSPEFCCKYNELLNKFHNVNININQVKMRNMNRRDDL